MKNILLLSFSICITLIASCQNKEKTNPVTQEESNGLSIPLDLLGQIRDDANRKILPFSEEIWKFDRDGNEESYVIDKGVYFDFVEENLAHSIFNTYKDRVKQTGNYIFLTELDFNDSFTKSYYDIVILEVSDQFELIRLLGTHGINYDKYTEDVYQQMLSWHELVNFEIVVVDEARIHANMLKKVPDMDKFCKEVYEFCPDVIDQGFGDMDEMISSFSSSGLFWMWWD